VSTLQDLLGALATLGRMAAIVALFLLLVVPHEGGHFAMAKLFGVHVREFSVGMGARLWSTVRSGTLYALRAFPLGGYVRLGGMEPDDYEDPNGFHTKPAYQRLLILLGGPAVNFIVATVLMTGVYLTQINDDPGKIVGIAQPGPAYAQGLRPGDSIQSVDGRPIHASDDIRKAEAARPGQPLSFQVRRQDGSTFTTPISSALVISSDVLVARIDDDPARVVGLDQTSPAYAQGLRLNDSVRSVDGNPIRTADDIRSVEAARPGQSLTFQGRHQDGSPFTISITPTFIKGAPLYQIGIRTQVFSASDALLSGVTFPLGATAAIGQGVWQVASGQVPGGFLGPSGVSGPIGFSYLAYNAASAGVTPYLVIAALLSMALGLTNLLPLPALDGGRIIVVLLEKVRGRPFDREREMAVQRAGLLALIALMALIAFFDVQRIATGQFPGMR
jgi:regulator of sigma E protease